MTIYQEKVLPPVTHSILVNCSLIVCSLIHFRWIKLQIHPSTTYKPSGKGMIFQYDSEQPGAHQDRCLVYLLLPPCIGSVSLESQRAGKRAHWKDTIAAAKVTPEHLKFCVDADWIGKMMDSRSINNLASFDVLTDEQLWQCPDMKPEEYIEAITTDIPARIVTGKLHIEMDDNGVRSSIENIFQFFSLPSPTMWSIVA